MKISGIYKIQSAKKPKKIYIGSSINISKRWNEHLSNLKYNRHPNSKLQCHYNKYGKFDLQFSVLIGCDKENLMQNEQFFIDAYNPWFNICIIAESRHGVKGQIAWNKGIPWSNEVKLKLSESHKGQTAWNKGKKCPLQSNETKAKRSESMKGKNTWAKGRKNSIESITRMVNSQKIRRLIPVSEETRRKQSESMKGRKATDQARKNMSIARLGQKASEETKRRMSESMKKTLALKRLTYINQN